MFEGQHEDDALLFDARDVGLGYKLSRNFVLAEAQSKCGDPIVWVHPATIVLAQHLRDTYGAIKINSWYRSKRHNTSVGGSSNSRHIYGMAIDVVPLEVDLDTFKHEILSVPIGGIGLYKNFVHLDVFGKNRRWE